MNKYQVSFGLAALALAPALTCQKPIAAKGTVKVADMSNRDAVPPVRPNAESVQLTATATDMPTWAACNSPVAGTCKIRGKQVAVIVGKSKADNETPDLIGIDLNADGKLARDEQMTLDVTESKVRNNTVQRSKPLDCTFKIDGVELTATVSYSASGDRATASVQFPNYLEATVKIADVDQTIAVVDKDLDGKFGSAGDLWTVRKPDDNKAATDYALSGIGERRFDKDHLIGIAVENDVVNVTTVPATEPDPKDAAAHRHRVEKIWTERFDKDRAEFYKARGLDESRPLAEQPIRWNYVSFEQGLAMAKQAKKPLFVDVMAFWCVWCYRMDYTTYPDKEVADLLNNSFVPVKIIQEQDLAEDYGKLMKLLEARGIPAMGIFDAEGNKLHTIGGWKKPEDFVKELQAGLDAAKSK